LLSSNDFVFAEPNAMPVRLRGHHFLCILTYRGYGYTPAFVENMTSIVGEIAGGRPVQLSEGPDAICGGLTADDKRICNHDCDRAETRELDRAAVAEIDQVLGIDFTRPFIIDDRMVERLRSAFADRSIRSACRRCPWSNFCTEIAAEAFSATKLFPPDAGWQRPSPNRRAAAAQPVET
jgi:hypothetical protein